MSKTENLLEKLPTNVEIEKGMQAAKKEIHAVRTAPGIDLTGHQILTDTERVIDSAEKILREKNEGDKIQELIREGQKASKALQEEAVALKEAGTPAIDTEGLRDLAEKTLETSRLAGIELISSNSFRKSLTEFLLLCYDIIAETEVEPATRQARKKGAATASTTTTTTTTTGPSVAPAQLRTVPASSITHPTTTAPPTLTTTPTPTTTAPAGASAQGDTLKEQVKEGLEGAINRGLEAAGADQRVHLSKEKLDDLVDRFIALMRNVSKRERTRNVFIGLLDMFKLFGQQVTTTRTGEDIRSKAEHSAAAIRYNKHVMKTLQLSRELFEQFTGDKSLDPFIYHISKINKALRRDPEIRKYFEELRLFVIDLLNHPELFDDALTGRKGRQLIKRGRRLHDKKLWVHLRGLLDESKAIVNNIQNDPSIRKLHTDMKRLIQDVMLDDKGNVVLKEHVLEQLRIIIVSSLIERMRLPIPTIHMEDKDMEYTLRNLVVSIRDLVPEKVVIENRGRLALDLSDVRQPEVEAASNTIRLVIQSINIHMEQADILFHRKTFPRVTDRGKLRMDIGGQGMDLIIQLQTYAGSRNLFRVEFVDCDVHNLSFYLQDTRHDWLYNSVLKLLSGRIKRGMERSIENTLINHLEQLNRMLLKQIRKTKGITKKGTSTSGGTKENLVSVLKAGKDVITGGGSSLFS